MCKRYIHQLPLTHPRLGTWPTTQACVLTWNLTCNHSVGRMMPNPLNHTSQGKKNLTLWSYSVFPYTHYPYDDSSRYKIQRPIKVGSSPTCLYFHLEELPPQPLPTTPAVYSEQEPNEESRAPSFILGHSSKANRYSLCFYKAHILVK